MAFTFVLVLSALAAYTQAVPSYSSGRLPSSRLSPVLGLGGRAVGSGLVAPIHNGHLGLGGGSNRYDASRLIKDSVYNRGRLGGSGLGRVGGLGAIGIRGHGHDSHLDSINAGVGLGVGIGSGIGLDRGHGIGSGIGLDRGHGIGSGIGLDRGHGIGSRIGLDRGHGIGSRIGLGSGLNGAGSRECMYLEYPSRCERSRGSNSRMRFTFVDGRCQQFYSSSTSRCIPRGINNNIFRTRYDCQQNCVL